jgi:hypothetical protein
LIINNSFIYFASVPQHKKSWKCWFRFAANLEKVENLSLGVSICLDVVSIETLNSDTGKKKVLTVEKISTISKSWSQQSRSLDNREVSIEIKKY